MTPSAPAPAPVPTAAAAPEALLQTPLHALHVAAGARMVPFAGYSMPVQYPAGVIAEHKQCRERAALFDVSHMGQLRLVGAGAAAALETLVPMDLQSLGVGKQRYVLFLNEEAGILDDLMVTNRGDDLFVVVNAACKAQDTAHLQKHLAGRCEVVPMPEQALLALQGPKAGAVLSRLDPRVGALTFMTGCAAEVDGIPVYVTRSGYTGEDGFEISVHERDAVRLAERLLADPEVAWAGLGARDTLRLEAGLCLYGHDIDAKTTPLEAGLGWAIQKVRRPDGERAGGYPGAAVLERQYAQGVARKRVGLVGNDRTPVREGAALLDASTGAEVGRVTSGTIGPTVGTPIALGYLPPALAVAGTVVHASVRGKAVPMTVTPPPFAPHRYHRG